MSRGVKHGMRETPMYVSWKSMRSRCLNVRDKDYERYGGRGITIDPRWDSFEAFYKDMGDCNGLTLERRKNDVGYSKENCVWATRKVQQNNRSNNRWIEFRSARKTLIQWSEFSGLSPDRIAQRIKAGWSLEWVFATPSRQCLSPKVFT